ncbi:MAG: methyl-accepting chemotaxis protein [Nitrospirales bacterium]|nr:methyl-accepting chemotaxis protein [Nitrospirales bacterium]
MELLKRVSLTTLYKAHLIAVIIPLFLIALLWTFSGTALADEIVLWGAILLAVPAGEILISLLVWKKLLALLAACSESLKEIAGDDLTRSAPDAEIGCLCRSVEAVKKSAEATRQNISSVGTRLGESAETLSLTIQDLSESQNQLAQVEQVVTSISEMSGTIVEVGRNASMAAYATTQALDAAVKGRGIVGNTVSAMSGIADTISASAVTIDELGQRSQEIGDIVLVINEIAEQTNLLALNAAIEAARAGEQGRGFAVVANEVRKLAERTGKATKEIADKVSGIQGITSRSVEGMHRTRKEVVSGVSLAGEASEALKEIVSASQNATDMVKAIAGKTEQQLAIADEITYNIGNVSSVIEHTSEANALIQQEAGNIAEASKLLQEMTESLQPS